jgi:hypothetical protein
MDPPHLGAAVSAARATARTFTPAYTLPNCCVWEFIPTVWELFLRLAAFA